MKPAAAVDDDGDLRREREARVRNRTAYVVRQVAIDANWIKDDPDVNYVRDIEPLLSRAANIAWVNNDARDVLAVDGPHHAGFAHEALDRHGIGDADLREDGDTVPRFRLGIGSSMQF